MLNDDFKLNNQQQIRKYMNGLHYNIQRTMIGRQFNNFEECSSCAMQLEQSLRNIQPRSKYQRGRINHENYNNQTQTSKFEYNKSKLNNNRNLNSNFDHYDNNNTETSYHMDDETNDLSEIEGNDHAYLNAVSRQFNRSKSEIDRMRRNGQCFKCGERNHLIKECPAMTSSQKSKNLQQM